ncbi:MAG TPA: hypothetical protein VGI43_09285 [Mucilaginibacter sp.]|jgi:hypothetical protein
MNNSISLTTKNQKVFLLLAVFLIASQGLLLPRQGFCQKTADSKLEKMPVDLERDYALSALPPHLRKGATIYLLDPAKGYYMDKKGTNGFICFLTRTEWEWGEFRKDITMPISFDAAGTEAIFPVYRDVAAMRASGKYTATQIKDIVIDRIRKGVYKAPPRSGVSYMLAPVMRGYTGNPTNKEVMTMNGPHYMFYAPYLNNADIGGLNMDEGPTVGNPGNTVLGEKKGPFGYIILPAGEAESAKIINDNIGLLKRLAAYKSYYKTKVTGG